MLTEVLKKQSGIELNTRSQEQTPDNRRQTFINVKSFGQDMPQNQSALPTDKSMRMNSMIPKKGENRSSQTRKISIEYQKNREQTASIFSKITFAWTIEILKLGRRAYKQKRNLQASDLFDCTHEETPEYSYNFMQTNFTKNMQQSSDKFLQQTVDHIKKVAQSKNNKTYNPSNSIKSNQEQQSEKRKLDGMLYESIKLMNSKDYIIATILSILGNLCQFVGPILLSYIIKFLKSDTEEDWVGYMYATFIFIGYLLRVFMLQHSLHLTNKVGIKVLNSLNTSIYSKILRLSSSSKKYYDSGKKIINNQLFAKLNYSKYYQRIEILNSTSNTELN